jgi:N-acetylglucosamine kinase
MENNMSKDTIYYGLDIGGTKIEFVAYNADMQSLYSKRIATPTSDYPIFLQSIQDLVIEADMFLGTQGVVGLGVPGVVDAHTGFHLSANVPAIKGADLRHDLQQRLQRDVVVANDCHCFAMSEANGGAAEGYSSMFGAIIGTGVGGGFCINGKLVSGRNGVAGEWGHWSVSAALLAQYQLPLFDSALSMPGILERYISGSGLSRLYQLLGGGEADVLTIVERAKRSELDAQRAIDIHTDLVAQGLATLVMALDPQIIVLGGGLSNMKHMYTDLSAAIGRHLFAGVGVPPVVPPAFGDAGGTRGAALLVLSQASV